MENSHKRLIILAVSGVLLSGAGYFYWDHHNKKVEQAVTEEVDIPIKAAGHKNPPVATATTTAVGTKAIATLGGATSIGTKPAVASGTANGGKPAATPAPKTDGAAVKPVVAIAPVMPAVKPVAVNPAVNIRPIAAPPPAVTNKAPVPTAPAVGAKPVAPAVATKPAAPAAATKPGAPAAATKPAAPAVAAKPVPQTAAKPAAPILSVKPASQTIPATPPVKPNAVAKNQSFPNGPRLVPTNPAPISAALAAQPTVQTPPAATPGNKHAATTFAEAIATAKSQEGRNDPMQPLATYIPFPRGANGAVPPPPPDASGDDDASKGPSANILHGAAGVAKKNIDKLVPPPPPAADTSGGGAGGELPITELPVPPSKPTIGDKLKVLAILDDRAVVAFPTEMRIKNKWPKTIRLGTGEEFESIKVVGVSKDGVTIEEDGERTLKPLSTVK